MAYRSATCARQKLRASLVSPIRTLEKHRIYGTGPRFPRGASFYSVEDLQTWVEFGTKMSTSDPGVATVLPAKRQSPLVPPPTRRSYR